ncbi:hypothetical protein BH10PSE5_BH10PSE5_07100 [soil metagenome]
MACVAILHGWSDEGHSFEPLRNFLAANGFATRDVFLGNYISMDDDVRVEDVAKRMDVVIQGLIDSGKLTVPFDLIVHSTGALVARQWMLNLHLAGRKIPVQRFIMLAPANFGSKLAAVGKSMIGRITKGLSNRLETGEEMLRSLELASPYQWTLTRQDLLSPPGAKDAKGPYGPGGVMPFVIAGTRAYDSGLQQIINEAGSDGTVRVSAADLNAVGMTIDFSPEAGGPKITPWTDRRAAPVPLAVLPERDHSEITHPEQDGAAIAPYAKRLSELLLESLRCTTAAEYARIAKRWSGISDETAELATHPERIPLVFGKLDDPKPDQFHRYLQVFVMVRDDYGNLVKDYFLEFSDPKVRRQKSMITFHTDVLEAVHTNSIHPAYRCLYIDHTDMMEIFYEKASELAVSISAAPPGRNVKYFDSKTDAAAGQIIMHAQDLDEREALKVRLFRNRTHLIEVIIPRRPTDKVFSFL